VRKEVIGNATLYLGDCLTILPTLDKADAVITDPPYGGVAQEVFRASKGQGRGLLGKKERHAAVPWDATPPDAGLLQMVISAGTYAVIFGGNYFALPPSRCWLVWDKETNGDFADCELAWTNLNKPVRRIRYMWNGMLRANKEPRGDHPTQKPIGVMAWCIGQLPDDCLTILDPFMGSGSTGVACAKLGKAFTGVEKDLSYFEIACQRIENAQRQERLFA
jgi:DNA modification methylase